MHYLSGNCPALAMELRQTLAHSLEILSSTSQLLIPPVLASLSGSVEDWVAFILDPCTDAQMIRNRQEYGQEAVWPLFRLSRAYIWCMDRERAKMLD